MRSLRLTVPLLSICVLALLLAGSAVAGDNEREVWVYKKGAETKEFDVTHLPAELRKALDTQAVAKGWKRQTEAPVAPLKADEAAPKPIPPAAAPPAKAPPAKAPPAKKDPGAAEALRKDLKELARRGGELPEGFVPHGMGPRGPMGPMGGMPPGGVGGPQAEAMLGGLAKAVGQLLLNYLDVKKDPVKAPIYEDLLRDLAKTLVEGGKDGGMPKVGMQMMGRFMAGMQDPAKAPVYAEILQVLGQAMGGALSGRMGAAAPVQPRSKAVPALPLVRPVSPVGPLPFKDAPAEMGGARLGYVTPAMSSDPFVFKVLVMGPVDPQSLAAQAGLRAGDQIEAVDGKAADPAGVRRAHAVFEKGGKLVLRVRRMDGRTEILDIELEAD